MQLWVVVTLVDLDSFIHKQSNWDFFEVIFHFFIFFLVRFLFLGSTNLGGHKSLEMSFLLKSLILGGPHFLEVIFWGQKNWGVKNIWG